MMGIIIALSIRIRYYLYWIMNLELMVTMRPLVKHRTEVLVLIANKYRYQWTMNFQRVLKTNLLHLQMENIWGGMSIWGIPKFKPIWSMMGIIIALSIRIRSYHYWMILRIGSYGCATKSLYETFLCSQDLWAIILILQRKWRALSSMEDCPCQAFRRAIWRFYISSFYGLHKAEYW